MGPKNSAGGSLAVALIFIMKALLAGIVAVGCAHSGVQSPGVGKDQPAAITGTNIAQPAKRVGRTYDSPQAIRVIDREKIDQSGARSVGDLLRREPGVRVR